MSKMRVMRLRNASRALYRIGACAGYLLSLGTAQAQNLAAAGQFVWERQNGAEECASDAELRSKINGMLGRDAFATAPGVTVSGVVRRENESLVATVLVKRGPDATPTTREFRMPATDCGPLSDAVALAVALSLEHDISRTASGNPPISPVLKAAPARGPQMDTGYSKPERKLPDNVMAGWSILPEARWTLGDVARPTTGIGLNVQRGVTNRIATTMGGFWLPPASERGQFSTQLSALRAGLCVETLRGASISLVNCGSGSGGVMRIANEQATVWDAGAHPWFAAALSAAGATHLSGNLLATGGLEATVPLARPTYRTNSCPQIGFRQPAIILGIFAAIGAHFL